LFLIHEEQYAAPIGLFQLEAAEAGISG